MKRTPELAEYCVYVPLCYNDGSRIEKVRIEKSLDEIKLKFGAFTRAKANEGIWIYKSKEYKDFIDKIEVLTYDTKENDEWFKKFKEVLKKRLKQKEIFVKKTVGMQML